MGRPPGFLTPRFQRRRWDVNGRQLLKGRQGHLHAGGLRDVGELAGGAIAYLRDHLCCPVSRMSLEAGHVAPGQPRGVLLQLATD